jgi:hypothetical protein
MWLVVLLLLIFGGEVGAGIALLATPGKTGAEQIIGYALVTSLLVGSREPGSWSESGAPDCSLR